MLTYRNISPIAVLGKQISILNIPVIYRGLCYRKENAQMALVSTIEGFGRRPEKTGKLLRVNWTYLVALSYHIWIMNYNCELVQVHISSWISQKHFVSYHFNCILLFLKFDFEFCMDKKELLISNNNCAPKKKNKSLYMSLSVLYEGFDVWNVTIPSSAKK